MFVESTYSALGLDDDQIRALNINIPKKGRKSKKTREQIEEELNFELRPIRVEEVPSVINAIRKALGSTQQMLAKLLDRLAVSSLLRMSRQA